MSGPGPLIATHGDTHVILGPVLAGIGTPVDHAAFRLWYLKTPSSRSRHWIDPLTLELAGGGLSNSLPNAWWLRSYDVANT
jgi:hypothetical protein